MIVDCYQQELGTRVTYKHPCHTTDPMNPSDAYQRTYAIWEMLYNPAVPTYEKRGGTYKKKRHYCSGHGHGLPLIREED